MKVVFLGTPDFAVPALKALYGLDCDIVGVVTQPDKPVGRKNVLTSPPVKQTAVSLGLKVFQFNKIRSEGVEKLKEINPDLMITCAFGQILSREILEIPRLGTINIHASLLPKYRGAAPIQWAIINGEKETGVTIMKTDVGIDTGDILFSEKTPIYENENAGELFDRLAILGAECLKKAFSIILSGSAVWHKQEENGATYVPMIKKEDALINWADSAVNIFNFIRGMNPSPCAFTYYDGSPVKIWKAEVLDESKNLGKIGEILTSDKKNGLTVNCGSGVLKITELQLAGGKRMPYETFVLGNHMEVGKVLGK